MERGGENGIGKSSGERSRRQKGLWSHNRILYVVEYVCPTSQWRPKLENLLARRTAVCLHIYIGFQQPRLKVREGYNLTYVPTEIQCVTRYNVKWTLGKRHFAVKHVRNVMAHAQKPDLVFQRNGRVHLHRRRCHFSRLLAAEECGSANSNCIDRVPTYSARLLATHSIRIFPLHFPSRESPCAIRFRTRFTSRD